MKSWIFDEKVWKIGKNRGLEGFLRGKRGFRGFEGEKVGFFMILGEKRVGFWRIFPNWQGFLGKIEGFAGEMREKGCWMSGAAARTGEFNKEERKTMWILYRERMV